MMSYALLGHIAFDLLNAPTVLDERRSAVYAQHDVLSGKPRLQAMGVALTEITLNLSLHHQLGAVDSRYQALIAAKESQQALALVLGFSKFKGHFVITELSSQALYTDSRGNALAREISITLREFVGNSQSGLLGAALKLGANSPLGSLLPQSAVRLIKQTKNLVTKGIQVYRQTRQTIDEVRNLVTLMKTLHHDPLTALSHLPFVVENLGSSLGQLREMLGLSNSFAMLTHGIGGTNTFLRDLGEIADSLNGLQSQFKQGLNDNKLGEWFDLGVKAIDDTEYLLEQMSAPVAQMTAWIVLRADEPSDEVQNG
ncbi:phage tail protein [Pasteurellaceae bacterium USgator11]|nr:phage tail protein [Pasteurellaceae bacterium USgator41]TNG98715.1 phage tail protein [Pasteurellaceae bacterium UScroc31]TNH00082.1 phage tail protein [Pasteurellaceae bacterium USgator11]